MKKALIISHSVQSAEALSQLLKIEYFTQISIADNSKTAKNLLRTMSLTLSVLMHLLQRKAVLSFPCILRE